MGLRLHLVGSSVTEAPTTINQAQRPNVPQTAHEPAPTERAAAWAA
jgi:hypothetical protein